MEDAKREQLLNTCSVIILDLLTPTELIDNNAETLIPYIKNAINKFSSTQPTPDKLKSSILEEIRKQIANQQEAYAAPASSSQLLDACSVIIKELSSYDQQLTVSTDKLKEAIISVSLEGWEGGFDNLNKFRVGGIWSIRTRILDRITPPPPPKAGRRRSNQSKKRTTTRRRRSSKRKVRKARTTRRR